MDDEPDIRKVVALRLETSGYTVIAAADGQEALKKAKTEKPDLIILDLMLPKVDGYLVCRLLKFDEQYQNIPIIILSARAEKEDIAKGYECHADAYLVKPFDSKKLLEKMEELLPNNQPV